MSSAAVNSAFAVRVEKVSQKSWLTGLSLAFSDVVAVGLATAVICLLRSLWQAAASPSLTVQFVPGALTLLIFFGLGMYPVIGLNFALEFQRVIFGCTLAYIASAGLLCCRIVVLRQVTPPPDFIIGHACSWLVTILLVFVSRYYCRRACSKFSWWGTPVIVFGAGSEARTVFRTLERHCTTGLKVVGVFGTSPVNWPELKHQRVHVGTTERAAEFAEQSGVSYAIVAMPGLTCAEVGILVRKHAFKFRHVIVLSGLSGVPSAWIEPRVIGGMLGIHLRQTLLHRRRQLLKRAFDLLLASIISLTLLPLFAIICAAVRLSSRGPIFYGHIRIGCHNSRFRAWKFRTMYPDADKILHAFLEQDVDLQLQWEHNQKLKKDPRVTIVGRILRKTSLDEIPQLWNVLRGEMSFVGPRPIVSAETARYGESFEVYTSVKPGITGLWQVSGRNDTSYEERIELDEYYVRNWSLWLDLYIVSRTIKTVLLAQGAY